MDDANIIALFRRRDKSAVCGFEKRVKTLCVGAAREITGTYVL